MRPEKNDFSGRILSTIGVDNLFQLFYGEGIRTDGHCR